MTETDKCVKRESQLYFENPVARSKAEIVLTKQNKNSVDEEKIEKEKYLKNAR